LWIFLAPGASLELFFKNQGSDFEILDHGLITLAPGTSLQSSLSSTKAWLKPTASLAVRGEKLGGDP
jgi:hypothetical protein